MPVLPSSPSDFTATVKSAAIANASVGGVSFRPSKNSGGYVSLGALGAIVTQSVVARATISQRFDPDLASAPAAPSIVESITLQNTTTGTEDTFIVKYDTAGSIQWARKIGGTDIQIGSDIITDSSRNIYVIGTSTGSTTIFGSDNTTTAFSLGNNGSNDTFIVKYNASGVPQWARRIGGLNDELGTAIAVDSTGNVYIVGHSNSPLRIFAANDLSTVFSTATTESVDIFLVKYNTDGTPLWYRKLSSANNDFARDMSIDSDGSLLIAGYTTGSTFNLLDATDTAAITLTYTTSINGFLVKYDTNGKPQWGRKVSNNISYGNAVATDASNNVYVYGSYFGYAVFTATGNISPSLTLPSPFTDGNAFIVKYSSSGEPIWIRSIIAGINNDSGRVATDSLGNLYITGYYNGSFTVRDGNNSGILTSPSSGENDVFIIKYDTNGELKWYRRIGSSGSVSDYGLGIVVDSSGNVYTTGFYTSTVSVFNGNGTTTGTTAFTTLANAGGRDAFLVKYNTTGTPLWAARMNGTGTDQGTGVTIDSAGNICVTGSFTSASLTLRTTGF